MLNVAVCMVVSKEFLRKKAAVGGFLAALRRSEQSPLVIMMILGIVATLHCQNHTFMTKVMLCATRNTPIPVLNKRIGRVVVAAEINKGGSDEESNKKPSKWKCTPECKLPISCFK